jgi:hypothetical protein
LLQAVAKPSHLNPLPLKGGEEVEELTGFLCQPAFNPMPKGGFEMSSSDLSNLGRIEDAASFPGAELGMVRRGSLAVP